LRKFIYGPGLDEPICLVEVAENNAVYYYHFDGLGSVVALSDVNSVLVERYTYDVFGRPAIRDANGTEIAESAFANPYLFTGRAYDAETGLYYYRARYYDYATARFLQPDPMGYTTELNLYTYCGNGPVVRTDPLGLRYYDFNVSWTPVGTVVGGAAGAISHGPLGLIVGVLLGGLGPTGGFQYDPDTGNIYPYVGLGWSTNPVPRVDASLTYSEQNTSAGTAVAFTGAFGVVGQLGYTFGENGGRFTEVGGSNLSTGFGVSVTRMFGPYSTDSIANAIGDTYQAIVDSLLGRNKKK
jgi:RHS repeat-associated protein